MSNQPLMSLILKGLALAMGVPAVEEDHYPMIFAGYERVTVDWWTHEIGRLQKDDFIMAAKTDELFESV